MKTKGMRARMRAGMKENETGRIINGPSEGGVTGILEERTAYNIVENEQENSAEITMYGEVVQDRPRRYWDEEKDNERLYIVQGEFLKDLEEVKNCGRITVRINSPGGELYAGIAIMNRLSELDGEVVTIVDGIAASAASIILQGGKKRKVHKGSLVMVHGASSFFFGYYNRKQLKEKADQLDAANRTAIEAYAQRTGLERDEISALLDQTAWMTGQEAIDKGFADELVEGGSVAMSISQDNAYMMVNGIRMSTAGFERIPEGIQVVNEAVIPGNHPVITDKTNRNEGGTEMTAEELREKYPALVAEIEASAKPDGGDGKDERGAISEAVAAERKRISEIDEIATMVGDRELVKKAKFESGMTAAELALESMRQQAKMGRQFMQDAHEEVGVSGANGVAAIPCGSMQEEMSQSDIEAGAALIAGIQSKEGKV